MTPSRVVRGGVHRRPPNAGKGRKKGVPNKLTASTKAALEEAFGNLGGVPSLVRWGKKNCTDFYKLWSKLVPRDIEMSGKDGGPLVVTVRFAREGRRVTAS